MTKNNYFRLLKLSEYMKCKCVVLLDGSKKPIHEFSSLQHFIDHIHCGDIETFIPEFETYAVSWVSVQESLLDEGDRILFVYLV